MNANLTAQAEARSNPLLPHAIGETAEVSAPLATDDSGRQVVLIEDGKQQCSCSDSCSGRTTRFFSQGHDARLVTRLRNQVVAGEMPIAEAFAEITKRGGTDRLQIKLDAAVANAAKPKAKKAKVQKLVTFELDGFVLREDAHATETSFRAKVGRWEYDGEVTWHRIVEEGATAADTVGVFRYEAKSGEPAKTTKWSRVVPEAGVAEAPADDEDFADIPF
jgi:hypothetical protein